MAHILAILLLECLFTVDDAVHDDIIVMSSGLLEVITHFVGKGAHVPRQKTYA